MGAPHRCALAGILIVLASSAAQTLELSPRERRAVPVERRWRNDDSERSRAIRRALTEIRNDPAQRKFILFRYGLSEEDLR